ncbi:MAG: hypothetical protein AAGE92_07655 [Cyanobacteria bacterium P01_G01_bin.4]
MHPLAKLLTLILLLPGCGQQMEETGFSNEVGSKNILLNGMRVSGTDVLVIAEADQLHSSFSFLSKQNDSNIVYVTVTDSFDRAVLKETADLSRRGEYTAVRFEAGSLQAGAYLIRFSVIDGTTLVQIPLLVVQERGSEFVDR